MTIILIYPPSLRTIIDHPAGCGITEEIKQWMESIQTSAVDEESATAAEQSHGPPYGYRPANGGDKALKKKRKKTEPRLDLLDENPYEKYTKEFNDDGVLSRTKRAIKKKEVKNTCSLFIQTDPLIWRHISEQVRKESLRVLIILFFSKYR